MLHCSSDSIDEVVDQRSDDGEFHLTITIGEKDVTEIIEEAGWNICKSWIDQLEDDLATKVEDQEQLIRDGAEEIVKEKCQDISNKLFEVGEWADEVLDKVWNRK